jgi:RNA polymerase sigma-70 factor (ECF subfamily)
MEDLYGIFDRIARYHFHRRMSPSEVEDGVHNTYLAVLRAILADEIRDPYRLMGYVRTVVRRQCAAYFRTNALARARRIDVSAELRTSDDRLNPEDEAISRERAGVVRELLAELPERDRDILTRFYLLEQTMDEICTELDLTSTQFRLLKSWAKTRFGAAGKKRFNRGNLRGLSLRMSGPRLH